MTAWWQEWTGGRTGGHDINGEWRPSYPPAYEWRRRLHEPVARSGTGPRPTAFLHASAYTVRDWGRSRRKYAWGIWATLGSTRVSIHNQTCEITLKSVRGIADGFVRYGVLEELWVEALQPWRQAAVYRDGSPVCTVLLGLAYDAWWDLPPGDYLAGIPCSTQSGEPLRRVAKVSRTSHSTSQCGGVGAPLPGPDWLPAAPRPPGMFPRKRPWATP